MGKYSLFICWKMNACHPSKRYISLAAVNSYRKGLCSFLDDKALYYVREDLGLNNGLWRFGVSCLTWHHCQVCSGNRSRGDWCSFTWCGIWGCSSSRIRFIWNVNSPRVSVTIAQSTLHGVWDQIISTHKMELYFVPHLHGHYFPPHFWGYLSQERTWQALVQWHWPIPPSPPLTLPCALLLSSETCPAWTK